MSIPTVVIQDAVIPVIGDNEEMHTVCCWHEDITMCGFVLDDPVDGLDDDDPTCVVCHELRPGRFCPVYGECREDDIL